MRTLNAFRSPDLIRRLVDDIAHLTEHPIKIMEFCGTHTHAISRYGLRQILPERVSLFSGPGCPVCVTSQADIDHAIALSAIPDVIITTFGDLLKVPGSQGSLEVARARGARVEIVYSPLDALKIALNHPKQAVIFLGIGFETTAPTVAASILEAEKNSLDNYFVYSMHKVTPPAMRAILDMGELGLDGVLCPGHVSAVVGWKAWEFLPRDYGVAAAVGGFEPVDVLWSVRSIILQHEEGIPQVANTYPRTVQAEGNVKAQEIMDQVFGISGALWRGIGEIPRSGLMFRKTYRRFDARSVFRVNPGKTADTEGCSCGEVIRGVTKPVDCPLFRSVCTPTHPVGPCMVSTEGTCAAYYLYG
ncbi:MAG TPA: hydrogenase formation protein HypD [Deltaproteobacteria bacterium]|nr:hydrogenase formation protein HypD [Deltaproteobacteria bacterium]